MDYPIEFPPQEIIKTLEKDLDSKFSHFTVSLDGNVEGIFIHHITQEPISIVFEIKRKALDTKTEMDMGAEPQSLDLHSNTFPYFYTILFNDIS